jgi:hypothetical protein
MFKLALHASTEILKALNETLLGQVRLTGNEAASKEPSFFQREAQSKDSTTKRRIFVRSNGST